MALKRPPYRRLNSQKDEIRLLQLFPGDDKSPLQGELIHVALVERMTVPYDTISYRWGDGLVGAAIEIDGANISAPDSALQILRRVRHAQKRQILWIDSVCIDQNDVEERSWQVALMKKIYSAARTNLIWLGEDEDPSRML